MIIKGRAVGSVSHWSRYLREQGENEKVTEHEIRATTPDLKEALEEMRDVARHTLSEGNFLYHASFNPKADETLTHEQWMQAIDRVEDKMGFKDHPRVIYEHVKEGRQHFHVLWSRVDPETATIRDIKGDRLKLRDIANELEREYGLAPTKRVRDPDDPRPYQEWEKGSAGRARIDPDKMKTELTQLWRATDSGKAFVAAAEERGYKIARGDRRDFVIVDPLGDAHSLARRLDGVRTADLRARFVDVDRDSLPSAAEARDVQRSCYRDEAGRFDREAAAEACTERSGADTQKNRDREGEKPESDHPAVFDRDAHDRDWQNAVADAGIAQGDHDQAELREGWAQLKAAYAKDLAPETQEFDGQGGSAPTFKEAWNQTVAGEREQGSLERSMPEPGMRGTTLADMDDTAESGMLSVLHTAEKVVTGLAEFLIGFIDPSPPKPMSREERSLVERRSERALDNMKRDHDRSQPFKDHDIKALTHHHLLQIREQGDPYLRDLLAKRHREQQRYLGNERER